MEPGSIWQQLPSFSFIIKSTACIYGSWQFFISLANSVEWGIWKIGHFSHCCCCLSKVSPCKPSHKVLIVYHLLYTLLSPWYDLHRLTGHNESIIYLSLRCEKNKECVLTKRQLNDKLRTMTHDSFNIICLSSSGTMIPSFFSVCLPCCYCTWRRPQMLKLSCTIVLHLLFCICEQYIFSFFSVGNSHQESLACHTLCFLCFQWPRTFGLRPSIILLQPLWFFSSPLMPILYCPSR